MKKAYIHLALLVSALALTGCGKKKTEEEKNINSLQKLQEKEDKLEEQLKHTEDKIKETKEEIKKDLTSAIELIEDDKKDEEMAAESTESTEGKVSDNKWGGSSLPRYI